MVLLDARATLPEALRAQPTVVMHKVGRGPKLEGIRVAARLTKPIKQEALRRALNAALEGSSGAVVSDEPPALVSQVKLRILMAEDNLVNQKVALKILERLGHTANVVANGQEALDALGRASYDIVLMDVHMPVMDGLEASRRILAQLPPAARPHIIALTASARPEDRQRVRGGGHERLPHEADSSRGSRGGVRSVRARARLSPREDHLALTHQALVHIPQMINQGA